MGPQTRRPRWPSDHRRRDFFRPAGEIRDLPRNSSRFEFENSDGSVKSVVQNKSVIGIQKSNSRVGKAPMVTTPDFRLGDVVSPLKNPAAHALNIQLGCIDTNLVNPDLVPCGSRLTNPFDRANTSQCCFCGKADTMLNELLPSGKDVFASRNRGFIRTQWIHDTGDCVGIQDRHRVTKTKAACYGTLA